MIRQIISISLFFILGVPLFSQQIMNLDEVLKLAMTNNYDINIVTNNVKKAKEEHHIGNAGMLPEVTANGSWGNSYGDVKQSTFTGETNQINDATNKTRSLDLSIDQTLFDGFAMFRAYDKLGKNVELQNFKKQEEIENMIAQVMRAYYDIVVASNQLKLVQQSLEYTQEQLEIVNVKEKAGKTSVIDVLSIEVNLAEDSSTYLDAQTMLQRNKNYLSFLLGGISLEEYAFDLQLKMETISTEKLNIENNVLIKQSNANLSITELDYEIYKAALYPKLYGSIGYGYNKSVSNFGFANETVNTGWNVGLTARWTIFQGFKRSIQMQTSKIDRMNQEISKEKVKQKLYNDFNDAKVNYTTALKKLALENKNLALFEKQYEVSKQLFELGKRTSLELRESQKQLFQARNKLFMATKEIKLQELEIKRLNGELVSFG